MKTTGQLKYLVGLCASLLLVVNATAQTTDYCKGLKNPTSFVITSAGNSANAQWYGFTGSRENQVSQCGNWGMRNWGSQIPASQLASQTSGSYCTSASPASTNINGQGDYMNRFVIKGPATTHLLTTT